MIPETIPRQVDYMFFFILDSDSGTGAWISLNLPISRRTIGRINL